MSTAQTYFFAAVALIIAAAYAPDTWGRGGLGCMALVCFVATYLTRDEY